MLEHRRVLSETLGHEVDLREAAEAYVANVLASQPDTRAFLPPS